MVFFKSFLNKYRYWFGLILVSFSIIFSGCGESQNNNTPNISNLPTANSETTIIIPTNQELSNNEFEYRWLNRIPCQLPCWEGITLGKTGAQEALDNVMKNPLFNNVNIISDSKSGYIEWKWTSKAYTGPRAEFNPNDPLKIIKRIQPQYPSEHLKLGVIINVYGQPSHIAVWKGGLGEGTYFVAVAYKDQGLMLDFYNRNDPTTREKPVISENLTTQRIIFFAPGYFNELDELILAKAFVTWEGFKTFDYYCQKHQNQISGYC